MFEWIFMFPGIAREVNDLKTNFLMLVLDVKYFMEILLIISGLHSVGVAGRRGEGGSD
jgi:hypothetical protein